MRSNVMTRRRRLSRRVGGASGLGARRTAWRGMRVATLGAHVQAGLTRERAHRGAGVILAGAVLVAIAKLTPPFGVRDATAAPASTATTPATPPAFAFGATAFPAPPAPTAWLPLLLTRGGFLTSLALATLPPHAGWCSALL